MSVERFPGWRWYDHPLARPLMLSRLIFKRKFWHPEHKRLARLRALYWWIVRHHDSEICGRCGGPVEVVFHVPDALWERCSGYANAARSRGGEAGVGVLCVKCVDDLYPGPSFLRWTCAPDDSVMVG